MSLTSAATALKLSPQMPFCPCCESQEVTLSFQKDHVDYHVCRPCGFTFVFPWPDDRTLRDHYDDYGRKYYSIEVLKDFLLSPKHCHREIAILLRATKLGTLLDVGCSVGGFVRAASQLGYAAEGIDISPSSVAVGQEQGLKIRVGDFLSAEFTNQFDVITMWATLEHLPDPNRYLRRAREQLRPGGILLASVPNFTGITQRLIGGRNRYVGIDHLNYWTARGFASYVARFGFEITETVTYGFNPLTLMKDWINRGQSFSCEQLAVQTKRNVSFKDSGIAHIHSMVEKLLNLGLLGDAVAVVGRLSE